MCDEQAQRSVMTTRRSPVTRRKRWRVVWLIFNSLSIDCVRRMKMFTNMYDGARETEENPKLTIKD